MMQVLMQAITDMVQDRMVLTESELTKEFIFTEDMQEYADVKAACIMLQDKGAIIMHTDKMGGMIIVDSNVKAIH